MRLLLLGPNPKALPNKAPASAASIAIAMHATAAFFFSPPVCVPCCTQMSEKEAHPHLLEKSANYHYLEVMAVSLWEVAYISAEVKVPLTPKN